MKICEFYRKNKYIWDAPVRTKLHTLQKKMKSVEKNISEAMFFIGVRPHQMMVLNFFWHYFEQSVSWYLILQKCAVLHVFASGQIHVFVEKYRCRTMRNDEFCRGRQLGFGVFQIH